MPPPGKPYSPSGAAGLSAREADEADQDYNYFLRHVRLDGSAYALYIPSKDGVSPPQVIRYEQPLPGSNVGAPVAGSEGGGQGGPPPLEEDSMAARESPHAAPYGAAPPRAGVKRKAPDANPRVEARSGAVPMEEDPVAEPAWYDSQPDMDEDYRFFIRHVSVVNERTAVFKVGNLTIPIGHATSVDNSDAEEDDDAEQEDEDESIPASGQAGEDGVGTEEEEEEDVDAEKEVKEEEVSKEEEECKEEVDSVDAKELGTGSDLQIVNVLEFGMKEEVEEEGEKPLNAQVQVITELEPLNREASSSNRHPAIPSNASELQGVIWPPHINERPNSDFKKKLMEILIEPFKQEEYDRYVAMATNRSPVVKERRTRHSVMYYSWTHEMGKSYFDRYPDLAEQFKLQDNKYPNRLALLRGLFFWLQNVGQEGQFRPWRDDFQKYRVVSIP